MGTSCNDVCDLMIRLVCEGCSDKDSCSDSGRRDDSDFHDQLIACIQKHVKVRAWLAWTDADIVATFNNLDNSGVLEGKIPEGYDVKEHIPEIIAELPIESMTTTVNERLYDEVLIYLESCLTDEAAE